MIMAGGRMIRAQSWRVRRSRSDALSGSAVAATDPVAAVAAVAVAVAATDPVAAVGLADGKCVLVVCVVIGVAIGVGTVAEGVDGTVKEGHIVGGTVKEIHTEGVGVGSVVGVFICAATKRGSTKSSIFLTHQMRWKESSILYAEKLERPARQGNHMCCQGNVI